MKPQRIFAGDWLEAIVRAWLLEFGFMANHSPWRNTTVNTGLSKLTFPQGGMTCRLIFRFFHCEVSSLRTWPKPNQPWCSLFAAPQLAAAVYQRSIHTLLSPQHITAHLAQKKVSLLDGSCFLTERAQPMGWEAHRSDTGIGIWSN